jgi:hypothetical protein
MRKSKVGMVEPQAADSVISACPYCARYAFAASTVMPSMAVLNCPTSTVGTCTPCAVTGSTNADPCKFPAALLVVTELSTRE